MGVVVKIENLIVQSCLWWERYGLRREDAFDWKKKKKNGESEFDKKLLTLASQDNDIKTDVVVVVVDLLILDKSMQMIFHSDNYHFDNWFYFYPLFL